MTGLSTQAPPMVDKPYSVALPAQVVVVWLAVVPDATVPFTAVMPPVLTASDSFDKGGGSQ